MLRYKTSDCTKLFVGKIMGCFGFPLKCCNKNKYRANIDSTRLANVDNC